MSKVGLPGRHRLVWIVSAGAGFIAAALFIVGLYWWRMLVPTPCQPPPYQCPVGGHLPPHHGHQTLAEAVWIVSTLFGWIALASVLWPDRLNHISRGSRESEDSGESPTFPEHIP